MLQVRGYKKPGGPPGPPFGMACRAPQGHHVHLVLAAGAPCCGKCSGSRERGIRELYWVGESSAALILQQQQQQQRRRACPDFCTPLWLCGPRCLHAQGLGVTAAVCCSSSTHHGGRACRRWACTSQQIWIPRATSRCCLGSRTARFSQRLTLSKQQHQPRTHLAPPIQS